MKKIVILFSLCICFLTVSGCGKNTQPTTQTEQTGANTQNNEVLSANKGDLVKIYYVGRSKEAGLFDTNVEKVAKEEGVYNEQRPYSTLDFTLGAGTTIPGMERGVVGMKVGETKVITIAPGEAYGEYREELVQELPKDNFATAGIDPVVGETYNFGIAQGKVLEINDDLVTLDFNHELAGQELTFEVTLDDLVKADVLNKATDNLADGAQ